MSITLDELSMLSDLAAGKWHLPAEVAASVTHLVERYQEILVANVKLQAAIRTHRDQRGDDRCWMDDYELYGILGEPIPEHACRLDEPFTMLGNCLRFVRCHHDPLKTYTSPQRKIDELEARLAAAIELAKTIRTRLEAELAVEAAYHPKLDESQRQMLLLAIALMSLDRPGWEMASRELARLFGGEEMYDSFRASDEDRFHPDPLGGSAFPGPQAVLGLSRCIYCGLTFWPDQNHPEHLCWANLASANQAAATWKMECENLKQQLAAVHTKRST